MVKMIKSDSAEFLIPLLVSVYTLIAIASVRDRILGIGATLVFLFIPCLASFNGPLPGLMRERGAAVGLHAGGRIPHRRGHRGVDHPIGREALEHGDAQLASQRGRAAACGAA
ncbi:Uncharacterised protein [Actinomyces viscosus]|uniref:Uncharacterized protein n=2 Tax=Actinomyces viscosus TaxID=1656 RepID=A0A3S4Z427_ACTVI|nr:Uncharacterised protein [Actinomyces viscosus]